MNPRKRITLLSLLSALVLPLLVVLPAGPAQAANTVCGKWDNMTVMHSNSGKAYTRGRICASSQEGLIRADAQAQTRDSVWNDMYKSYQIKVVIHDGSRVVARRACTLTKEANRGQQDSYSYSYSDEKMHCKLDYRGVRGRSYKISTVLVYDRSNDGLGTYNQDGVDPIRIRA